jgi:hypothetical protein
MFDLLESTTDWPSGWSEGALLEEKESKLLGGRRRVVEYAHASGAKLATSEHWHLASGEFMHVNFRVRVVDEACPAGWVPVQSFQTPGASEDRDWLIPGRAASLHKWRTRGQWQAIGELMDHLGLKVDE